MKCVKCGKDLGSNNILLTEDDEPICEHCADEHYYRCNSCGRFIDRSYRRGLCNVCDSSVYNRIINSYSTKPIPRFQNKYTDKNIDTKSRYYGLEMEYSNIRPEYARALFLDLYKDKKIYNKSDGSLYSGVEIVTNPCDLFSIKKLIKDMSEGLSSISKVKRHTDNAGLHIHVTKKSIEPVDRYKLGYLFNGEASDRDRKILMYLCGRCKLGDTEIGDGFCNTSTQRNFSEFGRMCGNRHIALNFNNDNTIEFRVYKSSADVDTLLSYIEITNQAIEFCHNNSIKNISIVNFILWLNDNSKNNIIREKINMIMGKYSLTKTTNVYKLCLEDIEEMEPEVCVRYYNALVNSKGLYEAISKFNSIRSGSEYLDDGSEYNWSKDMQIRKDLEEKAREYYIEQIEREVEECV